MEGGEEEALTVKSVPNDFHLGSSLMPHMFLCLSRGKRESWELGCPASCSGLKIPKDKMLSS